MNQKIWERKVRELQSEKLAAGDYISKEDAEKIIVSDDTYSYNARNSEGKCVFYEELVIR